MATKHKKSIFLAIFALGALTSIFNACQDFNPSTLQVQPDGDQNEGQQPLFVNLNFCDDLSSNADGRLCAIRPSKTDSTIKDFALDNIDRPGVGFGYHVIGVPNDWNKIKGVWIHFVGSYGTPYVPGGVNAGIFATRTWVNELIKEGYFVISIAYNNPESVNGDICSQDSPGINVDNCAGDVRKEILEGVNYSSQVEVSNSNSVFNRFKKLSDYLVTNGLNLPTYARSTTLDWSKIYVSGHSQGAGHSYYLAKNYGVKFACLLGGPYDLRDNVNPPATPIADWYLVSGSLTDISQIGAFVLTTDDSYTSFIGAYNVIGLVKNTHWFEVSGTYTDDNGEEISGHGAAVAAPALASYRAQACFR